MSDRKQKELLATFRCQNRDVLRFATGSGLPAVLFVVMLGLVTALRTNYAPVRVGSFAAELLVLAALIATRYAAPGLLRKWATPLLGLALLALLQSHLCDAAWGGPYRFHLFLAMFVLACLLYGLPFRLYLILVGVVSGAALCVFFLFTDTAPVLATTAIATAALIGIAYKSRSDRAIVTNLELRRQNIRLRFRSRKEQSVRQAYEESETRYESVVGALSEGIVIQARSGEIVACNQSAEQILGLSFEQMNGRKSTDPRWRAIYENGEVFPGEEHPAMVTLRTGRPCQGVIMGVHKPDGQLTWIEINSQPLSRRGEDRAYSVVTSFTDITARKADQDLIRHQAFHDDLTGLANRTLLKERLELELAHAARNDSRLAVMFCDLDGFKNVNDSLGHPAGDALLVEIAGRLMKCTRRSDTVARQGGDEFIIVLPAIRDVEAAREIAQKMLRVLEEPFSHHGMQLSVSGSIGIALYPEAGNDSDTLLRSADAAMYLAKDQGRASYCFFSDDVRRESQALELEAELREALDNREFELVFQPRYRWKDRRVTAVEALLRWPRNGAWTAPIEFLPVAEETGLILDIGRWVTGSAVAACQKIRSAIGQDLICAVNFSRRQLTSPRLVEHLGEMIGDMHPARFEIEIAAGNLVHQEITTDAFRQIKRLGAKISIDDFGPDHSSLGQLKGLRVDALKIDGSFISGLPENTEHVAIVQAIIKLAKGLGLQTVAEGVETKAQAQFLEAAGCDEMQGYLYSKPLPFDELLDFLERNPTL
ncbi:MAG: EAL domain-containing protein [Spirochaetales bacterium]|nr:EAL domain-containing protein [Leptospiraceae bacterium]MCP5479990.1 EAL domain-containing protein [Spirochaetales bacterium]MCP5486620.1 EAL domain-containing protein [Spirochaetales bacterium]